ncbi:putative receptor protein kinase ZmPK1 [Camellia lanceoleosa]|uniref:Receptor protein kinase ZmPK1 n=1 Tax=Camellia lanceoleosa TaxID=1840588 RepID=A0ACC0FRT1_9ERIC|nr:putative receptor protein kinase ZmPK1 [Camellia lanceoleosa]
MANRDQPVNGRLSKLSLLKDGNLILTDANNRSIFWATNTASSSLSLQLRLQNSVPNQPLTRYTQLVSKRSEANHSSGFYKLIFDRDNMLRLVFDGPETSSNYWPDPWLLSNEANRSSLEETSGNWVVSWQAMSRPCRIHGACGPNSICNFDPSSGRKCSCLPWFKMRNPKDWFDGCEPEFNLSCSGDLKRTVEFTTATKWVFRNGHHSPNVVGMLNRGGMEEATLVKWVMEKVMNRGSPMTSWVGEIVDPMLNGAYDAGKVEKLVEVALQCLEEEKDARPTMTRVVDMLQR